MAEALLKPRPLVQLPEPEDQDRDDGEGGSASPSPVMLVGFMLLAFSSAMVLGAVTSFLVFSFLDLAMLSHCLRLYTRTPLASSPRRELLMMAAWLLASMLVVTFLQLLELWFLTTHGENN